MSPTTLTIQTMLVGGDKATSTASKVHRSNRVRGFPKELLQVSSPCSHIDPRAQDAPSNFLEGHHGPVVFEGGLAFDSLPVDLSDQRLLTAVGERVVVGASLVSARHFPQLLNHSQHGKQGLLEPALQKMFLEDFLGLLDLSSIRSTLNSSVATSRPDTIHDLTPYLSQVSLR